MVVGKASLHNAGCKTAGRIEGTASEEHAGQFCDKKRKPTSGLPRLVSWSSNRLRYIAYIPTGAMKVALCFSAASMKIVNTSCTVRNISMNNPWARLVFPPKVVCTVNGPGSRAETTAAAHMAPSIWVTNKSPPRSHVRAPIKHMPSVTAGLKRPPLIRKKVHAFTANENPNANEMNSSLLISELSVTVPWLLVFAIWVAPNAKKRKRKVPMNSPSTATKCPREPHGRYFRKGSRAATLESSISVRWEACVDQHRVSASVSVGISRATDPGNSLSSRARRVLGCWGVH